MYAKRKRIGNFYIHFFVVAVIPWFASSVPAQRLDTSTLKLEILDSSSGLITQGDIRLLAEAGALIAAKEISPKQPFVFQNIDRRSIKIEVVSYGFEPFQSELDLKPGINTFTIVLKIKGVKENVEVSESENEKRLNQAFSKYLSREEIDSLPDDPREIEKELKRRYGDDLTIRINGFTGGQIPPKEMIRSIQVNRSSFDAEFHELGTPNINIITKASIPKFIGMAMFDYGNSALNARNAFAREKLPAQNRMFMGFISGPINKKSSFMASYNNFSNSRKENIIVHSPLAGDSVSEVSSTESRTFLGNVNYDIGKHHTFRLDYQNTTTRITNAGVGGFNLLERGFNVKNSVNEIKASFTGTFAKKYSNQFRARYSFNKSESLSNSQNVGVTVSQAFNIGGSGVDNSSGVNKFEAFEMVSFGAGKHVFKFGGEFHLSKREIQSSDGTNGSFFFRSLRDYVLRRPSTYVRTEGTTDLSFDRKDLALFVQDEFRIAKRMQIGLGLRYELQSRLSDRNNFSPRLSAALVLDEKAKFVLRSGAGILYQWHTDENIQRILSNDGSQRSQIVILNPGFPAPDSGGVLQEPLPPSVYRQDENLKNPYIFVTQTALNMNLGDGVKFDASYKFERGLKMFRSRDVNAPVEGDRPDPAFGRIRRLESSGTFTRNSFEINGEGVLFKRVRVNGKYRLSKAVNDFSGAFGLPVDNYNLSFERGPSDKDQRHYFTARFDYSPFKDFRVNPSFTIGSPFPYTITTGLDNNGDSVFNDRPFGVARNTERGEWTKTANLSFSWAIPIMKRSVSVEKDGKREPAENLPSLLKYHKLNLTVNVNNLFNTTNKSGFVGNQLSPFFRQATRAAPARSITFNLMFLYF